MARCPYCRKELSQVKFHRELIEDGLATEDTAGSETTTTSIKFECPECNEELDFDSVSDAQMFLAYP